MLSDLRKARLPVFWLLFAGLFSIAMARSEDSPPILRIEANGHTSQVRQVVFTPDGKQLVSVGYDKAVRLWNLKDRRIAATLRTQIALGRTGHLSAAAVRPTAVGMQIAVGGYDRPAPLGPGAAAALQDPGFNEVRIFNLGPDDTVQSIIRLQTQHREYLTSLAFAPENTAFSGSLVSGSADGVLCLWNAGATRPRWSLRDQGTISSAMFSPDGRSLAVCTYDGKVRLVDAGNGRLTRTFHCAGRFSAWSPDGAFLAVAGYQDGMVHLLDPVRDTEQRKPLPQGGRVTCLAFSPDGRWLVSGSGEDRDPPVARLWSMPDGKPGPALQQGGHDITIFSLAFSPDGTRFASADAFGVICVWDLHGSLQQKLASTGAAPQSIAWSADGKQVKFSSTGSDAHPQDFVFDLEQCVFRPETDPAPEWNSGLLLRDEKGRQLVPIKDPRGDISSLEIRGGKCAPITPWDQGDVILCYSFTPDGKVVVGSRYHLEIYDISGSQPRLERSLVGHDSAIGFVAVSGDGRYLASASADQTVSIWTLKKDDLKKQDTAESPLLSVFHSTDGEWVTWTPFGYYNASPGGDRLIGWQVNKGPGQQADFYDARTFRSAYYRPDIMSRLLATGSVKKAAEAADEARKPAPRILPPEISAVTPADGETNDRICRVRAQIRDPRGRKLSVFLWVNGTDAAVNGTVPASGEWDQTATLSEGLNILILRAQSDDGYRSEATLHLTLRRPEPPTVRILSPGTEMGATSAQILPLEAQIDAAPGRTLVRVSLSLNSQVLETIDGSQGSPADLHHWTRHLTLAPGVNSIVLRAEDDLGTQIEAVRKLRYDPPKAPEIRDVQAELDKVGTAYATLTARVTDPDGRPVTVSIARNGRPFDMENAGKAPASGEWSQRVALEDGDNTIVIRAENDAQRRTEYYLRLAYHAPRPPQIQVLPPTGPVQTPMIPVRVLVSKESEKAVLSLAVNGALIASTELVSAGADWSPVAPLREGTNSLVVRAVTPAGLEKSIPFDVVYHAPVPPVVEITSPAAGATELVTHVAVHAHVVTPGGRRAVRLTLLVNGKDASGGEPDEQGQWVQTAALSQGPNILLVRAVDDRGLQSEASVTIQCHEPAPAAPRAPLVSILIPDGWKKVPDGWKSPDARTLIRARITPNDGTAIKSVSLYLNGQRVEDAVPTWYEDVWSQAISLSEGRSKFVVRALNQAGVETDASITVDYKAPQPPLIEDVKPADGSLEPDGSVVVSARVSDPDGRSVRVRLYLDSREIEPVESWLGSPTWSRSVPLHDGDNTLLVHAENDAGAQREVTLHLRVPRAPTVKILAPVDGGESLEPVATIQVRITTPDGAPLRDIQLEVKGHRVDTAGLGGLNGDVWTGKAPLDEGANALLVRAATDAKLPGEAVCTVIYHSPKPPVIEEFTATPDPRLGCRKVTVRARVTDPAGRQVKVDVCRAGSNGVTRDLQRIPAADSALAAGIWTRDFMLPAGDSVLVLRAVNDRNAHSEQQIAVHCDPPKPPAIHVDFPRDGGEVKDPDVSVRASAADAAGKALPIVLLVNDKQQDLQVPVRLAEGENELVLQAADEYGVTRKVTLKINHPRQVVAQPVQEVEKFKPPTVDILSPKDGDQVTESDIDLKASVSDPNGLEVTVTWEVNGFAPQTRDLRLTEKSEHSGLNAAHEVKIPVALREGDNIIVIHAVNAKGAETIRKLIVSYKTSTRKPVLHVLAVGVSKYQNPEYTLKFAAKDAEDFAAFWPAQKGGLFADVQVTCLTDEKASRDEILTCLLDWRQHWSDGDWAIVFLSGHGLSSEDDYFYAPYDFDLDKFTARGISAHDLIDDSLKHLIGTKLLLLDTCHANGVNVNAYTTFVNDSENGGLVTLVSCKSGETSIENAAFGKGGNGAFTAVLMQGLTGDADRDGNGYVQLSDLGVYLAKNVGHLTEGHQHARLSWPSSIDPQTRICSYQRR